MFKNPKTAVITFLVVSLIACLLMAVLINKHNADASKEPAFTTSTHCISGRVIAIFAGDSQAGVIQVVRDDGTPMKCDPKTGKVEGVKDATK